MPPSSRPGRRVGRDYQNVVVRGDLVALDLGRGDDAQLLGEVVPNGPREGRARVFQFLVPEFHIFI